MKVTIKETGEVKTLSAIDRNSGVDWTSDLLGNAGALTDGQIEYDYDEEIYRCDMDTYEWWKNYIDNLEATDSDIEALSRETGISEGDIRARISEETDNDYETHRRTAIRVIEEIRDENK